MNYPNKPMPLASLPDNWSAFNDREVLPWQMSRADAAAVLQRARSLRARGQATISGESVGRYRLSTFNTRVFSSNRPDNVSQRPGRQLVGAWPVVKIASCSR